MASGIIEYLAEGAWTKRMHAGWAAQSGLRAALLGRAGFLGPRTVFEGTHGLFHGFAHTTQGDYDALTGDFGERWVTETLAFKPYPCGTMTHPYIDCARRLAARGIKADDITEIVCEVGEGTVHRLWEPLADKQRPPNGYAGKFSTPYCIAAGFVRGNVGLDAFTDAAVHDAPVLALAAKVRYEIDPANPYPNEFHRPHPRDAARRQRDRGAPAPHARRRARAADAPGHRGEVRAQCPARRLGRADRAAAALKLAQRLFDGPHGPRAASRMISNDRLADSSTRRQGGARHRRRPQHRRRDRACARRRWGLGPGQCALEPCRRPKPSCARSKPRAASRRR